MSGEMSHLTLELLTWIAEGRRTYGETIEAWRSTCPRQTDWEDAILDHLVKVNCNGRLADSAVVLTDSGRSFRNQHINPAGGENHECGSTERDEDDGRSGNGPGGDAICPCR